MTKMGRPPLGTEPMTRRNVFLPDDLWAQLETYAVSLSVKEGKPVSVAEGVRRILERSMNRRGK
jgi:hypothetical protein